MLEQGMNSVAMRPVLRGAARPLAGLLATAAVTVALAGGSDHAIAQDNSLRELGFTAHERQKIERGEIIGRTAEADPSAVALVVAGTIAVPPAFYIEKLHDIAAFKKTAEVLQIGRFARVPSADDLAGLTLDDADVNELQGCRVGDCGVKLDEEGISQLALRHTQSAAASVAMRHYLTGYVQRYLEKGNGSLIEYRDAATPRRLADELGAIVKQIPQLERDWPALHKSVAAFAGAAPATLDHFIYWSKEKLGPRGVISVTHAIISPLSHGKAAIASKQLYASHYTNGSLGLTILVDKGTVAAPRTLVVYVNRSRVDIFGGLLGGIKRPLVRSKARDGAERMMRQLREGLEREYRAGWRAKEG